MRTPATLARSLLLPALLVAAGLCPAADPAVSNVRAAQRPGTKLVDIYYDVTGTTAPVAVGIQISDNGGTTYAVAATALSGHVGPAVAPGRSRHAVWDAAADWNLRASDTVRFRVTATQGAPEGMVLIPAGSFVMGDQSNPLVGYSAERPAHTVYVSAFYMAKYEVTKELWDEVRAWGLANGYTDLPAGNGSYASKGANHPVHSISWYAMVKWCNARSQKEGLTPCYTVSGAVYKKAPDSSAVVCDWNANGYRLPTEAEWEKAARGGLAGKNFPWGDIINHSYANYYNWTYSYESPQGAGCHPTYAVGGYPYTSPVGSFAPNGYGLYDMAGNVWEWCWDWYSSSYYSSSPGSDPRGAASGSYRVFRGGSWNNYAINCRAAGRYDDDPSNSLNFGFRSARSSVP